MAISKLPMNASLHSLYETQEQPMGLIISGVKRGYLATISIVSGDAKTLSANTVLFTLPEAYRPSLLVDFVDSYGKKRLRIDPNGQLINMEDVSTYVRGSITYVTNVKGG